MTALARRITRQFIWILPLLVLISAAGLARLVWSIAVYIPPDRIAIVGLLECPQ